MQDGVPGEFPEARPENPEQAQVDPISQSCADLVSFAVTYRKLG